MTNTNVWINRGILISFHSWFKWIEIKRYIHISIIDNIKHSFIKLEIKIMPIKNIIIIKENSLLFKSRQRSS